VHFKYYLDNTAACLGLIDGKVLSSEKVLEKKRQKKVRAATQGLMHPRPSALSPVSFVSLALITPACLSRRRATRQAA
jgi:hypothetical protein